MNNIVLPKRLYKYLKREHGSNMVTNGTIRIGTLYEFRNYENQEIGDLGEGTKDRYTIPKNGILHATKKEDLYGAFKELISIDGGGTVVVEGTATIKTIVPDAYIYCFTEVFDEKTMLSFECDCCVEIYDVEGFLKEVIGRMSHLNYLRNNNGLIGKCKYIGRVHDYENTDSPYWLKDEKYIHQQEYRLVCEPNANLVSLEPVIIKSTNIKRFCKLISN